MHIRVYKMDEHAYHDKNDIPDEELRPAGGLAGYGDCGVLVFTVLVGVGRHLVRSHTLGACIPQS